MGFFGVPRPLVAKCGVCALFSSVLAAPPHTRIWVSLHSVVFVDFEDAVGVSPAVLKQSPHIP